jgi:tRNA(Ile)-lysidine synthase
MIGKLAALAARYDMLPDGALTLVCVSGGADSMALLGALTELRVRVAAAHFNHNLRPESAEDAAFVRRFCEGRGIPFYLGQGHIAPPGVEEKARKLRYAFFEKTAAELGADRIATAHTANDNAETLLLNLARGAGTHGLAGIPPARGNLVRPLLTVTRAEVLQYLAERSIPHVEDATNADDRYARNKIRLHVIPRLLEINPRFIENASKAAAFLRADDDFINSLPALPPGLRRGAPPAPPEKPLVFSPVSLSEGVSAQIPELEMTVLQRAARGNNNVNKTFTSFLFKNDKICGRIVVRPRRAGDALRLYGRGCTKSLKKLFIENHIPARRRQLIPVVADDLGVLAVFGVGIDARAVASDGDAATEIKFEGTVL